MPLAKQIVAQRDFSAGEVDPQAMRRDDHERMRKGARRALNWRPLYNGDGIVVRTGRRIVSYVDARRSERLRISPTLKVDVCFPAGKIEIRDADTGALITSNTGYPWTNETVGDISMCLAVTDIVMCYPGMRPKIARWNPDTGAWSFVDFAFRVVNLQTQAPFYRFSVRGASLNLPPARTGTVTVGCTEAYFASSMVGGTLTILGQQCTIASVTNAFTASLTIINALPDMVRWTVSPTFAGNVEPVFKPGMVVAETTNGRKAEVGIAVTSPSKEVYGTLMNSVSFYGASGSLTSEILVSPLGAAQVNNIQVDTGQTLPVIQWAEYFMGDPKGWPQSCFFSKNRLGFCDFPQMPEAILWSAVGAPDIFWIDPTATQSGAAAAGALPSSAILEFIPGKPRVRHVVDWGDLFAFTDKGVYQIPVSTTNPLKPGSVEFRLISSDGASGARPLLMNDAIVYVNAGKNRLSAIIPTGSTTRPFVAQDATDFNSHLINAPVCVAFSTGDSVSPERYAYVCNADGSLVIGKWSPDRQFSGWFPWRGRGFTRWVSAFQGEVSFLTSYAGKNVVEVEDTSLYVDGGVFINAPPAALALAGKGPLMAHAGSSVSVMKGAHDYGERQVDGDGFLLPEPGDDFSNAAIVAGVEYEAIFEPFAPHAPPGADSHQRMRRRRIVRAAATVTTASGFAFGGRDIAAYDFDDDASGDPVPRERTHTCRPLGRAHDPRFVSIVKTRPGPMDLIEFTLELTV
jgi:hypothetical protein